ncbi:hypothetical protein NPIL_144971, partial [Nephila pilipes]
MQKKKRTADLTSKQLKKGIFNTQPHICSLNRFPPLPQLKPTIETHLTTKTPASLYLGEIILAVEHIHKEGIIHRDLKPTNILFDAEGHLRLADFKESKQIDDGDRTFTICGTSVYMAPEILLEIGYDKSVDWWSVGAIMYQMLTGEIPYFDLDCGERQNNIYLHKIVYPDYVSTEAENLMRG